MVAVSVPPGVPGVVVVDESGVDGEGVSVGRDKPGLVGGRVDVMKTDLVGAGVSSETLMHEASVRVMSSITIQIFFMRGFYIANITKCRIICLITDLNFHGSIHVNSLLACETCGKNSCPGTGIARKCRDSEGGTSGLWLGKDHGVEAVVIEEGVSHADLCKGGAHQVLTVAYITPVIDPPVDSFLPAERGIIAIDVFGDGPGDVAGVGDTGAGCGTIRACMDIDLVAGDVVGVSLCRLG